MKKCFLLIGLLILTSCNVSSFDEQAYKWNKVRSDNLSEISSKKMFQIDEELVVNTYKAQEKSGLYYTLTKDALKNEDTQKRIVKILNDINYSTEAVTTIVE